MVVTPGRRIGCRNVRTMTVLLLERVSRSVRGDLSRWLLEVATGVFIGQVSERVRESLWLRAVQRARTGSVLMIWRARTEQGFDIRAHNPKGRIPIDSDGIWLMLIPKTRSGRGEKEQPEPDME
jgi:CRISPR-associated protein Cas2